MFYDPNDPTPAITKSKATQIVADLQAFLGRGHTVELVAITSLEEFLTAFNALGSDGKTIDTVVLYFHGHQNYIAFREDDGSGENHSIFNIEDDMEQITNENSINRIIFLSCYAGKGDENIARAFANLENVNSVIASDGYITIMRRPVNGGIRLRHMPSDTDGRWRLYTSNSYYAPRMRNDYGNIGRLIRAADRL